MEQNMIRLFIGYDAREAIGTWVFLQSLRETTKTPVSVTIIGSESKERDGTNAFIFSRFLIPELCNYDGHAIFMDGADMLLRADLAGLWALRSAESAVQVVKHDYKTKHPRKYVGTELEDGNVDYPRKNWSSVVLWNCGHPAHRALEAAAPGAFLHRFGWLAGEAIGELPKEWNHLVGEYEPNPNAKVAHFTLGVPGFSHYANSEFADEWKHTLRRSQRGAW